MHVRPARLRLVALADRRDEPHDIGRRPAAQTAIRHLDAAQRADPGAVGGSFDADRAPAGLVSRRLEEREERPYRLRAPLRAPDVQGLEERRAGRAHLDDRPVGGQSNAYTTDDETVFWETVPSQYLPLTMWLEADRMATLRIDKDTFVERARSREGRAPDARRQSAVRPAHRDHLRQRLHHASLQASDDRQHGGPRGGVDRRRARFLPDLLRAGERDRRGRRRFRHGSGQGSSSRQYLGRVPKAEHPVPRDIPQEPPQTAERRVDACARRGRCRRSSSRITSPTTAIRIRIRCTSPRKCCPTARRSRIQQ